MYFLQNHGTHLWKNYPYQPLKRSCQSRSFPIRGKKFKSWGFTQTEDVLLRNVRERVTATTVQVDDAFRYYQGGIFYNPGSPSSQYNHWVSIVGFWRRGNRNFENLGDFGKNLDENYKQQGRNHWFLRNSWGTQWGINGGMRIAMTGSTRGQSGIYNYQATIEAAS